MSIAQAATDVSYESEAAFKRALKKHVGLPPGAWRRGRVSKATGESAFEKALTKAGVVFVRENGDGAGARLKRAEKK